MGSFAEQALPTQCVETISQVLRRWQPLCAAAKQRNSRRQRPQQHLHSRRLPLPSPLSRDALEFSRQVCLALPSLSARLVNRGPGRVSRPALCCEPEFRGWMLSNFWSSASTDFVRITVFCSAIVIDVIVHCHTAGAFFESNGRKQLSLSSCGWVLILSGQFIITLVAELGIQPLIRSFWTETSAITFSTFSIAVTVFPSSTYGGDLSWSVDGACIVAVSAQCARL